MKWPFAGQAAPRCSVQKRQGDCTRQNRSENFSSVYCSYLLALDVLCTIVAYISCAIYQ